MNYQWLGSTGPLPIVEFHDVRTEKASADSYLSLFDARLAAPLLAAGVASLGQFRVTNHPDRLILLRGFAGIAERRHALTAFHASSAWAAHRAEANALIREESVILSRAVAPATGARPLRLGEPHLALVSEVRFPEQIGNYHLWLRLLLRKAGLDPVAAFATLEMANDVPAVPVVRNRTQHIALLPTGGPMPDLPSELRGMLRYAPELLRLEPARALVW